jgi:hypothetical protein
MLAVAVVEAVSCEALAKLLGGGDSSCEMVCGGRR